MKVLSKYLIVKKINEKKQAGSGLILSGSEVSDMRYHKAVTHSVGDGITGINAGDTILYDKVQSHEIILDNERMTIIQERDVVCVFD